MPEGPSETSEHEVPDETPMEDVILNMDGDDTPVQTMDDIDLEVEQPPGETAASGDQNAEIDALKKTVDEIKEQNRKLESRIGYEMRKSKQDERKSETPESGLTREQLVGILDQNRDDPETLLRVFDYVADQKAKGAKVETLDAAKIDQERREIEGNLYKQFPMLQDETSELSRHVEMMADRMRLDNHPFRKHLAHAALTLNSMPKIIEHWKEVGRKEALDEKADDARKKGITNSKLPDGKPSARNKKAALPENFDDNAKQFGMTPAQKKIYAKLLGSKATNITMEE